MEATGDQAMTKNKSHLAIVECMFFYANPENYKSSGPQHDQNPSLIARDKGRKAHETIKLVKKLDFGPDDVEYVWPTIEEYEKSISVTVNEAFRIGWDMARTQTAHIKAICDSKDEGPPVEWREAWMKKTN